jgi:hypothetical protein
VQISMAGSRSALTSTRTTRGREVRRADMQLLSTQICGFGFALPRVAANTPERIAILLHR